MQENSLTIRQLLDKQFNRTPLHSHPRENGWYENKPLWDFYYWLLNMRSLVDFHPFTKINQIFQNYSGAPKRGLFGVFQSISKNERPQNHEHEECRRLRRLHAEFQKHVQQRNIIFS